MDIPRQRKGRILSGDSAGWYILVKDDPLDTGGIYIHTSKDISFDTGFDEWAENEAALVSIFRASGWTVINSLDLSERFNIEWLDQNM
ncbi:hypothetical protein [Ferrovibrio sp.]|uniref:hypothetical protein n=1 Tax=Ferrovibrio sp. TaxID=1917215 RepID=UPI003D0EB59E